jgi:hypothetical protein
MFFALLPVTIAAIVGLAYTWVLTYEEVRAVKVLEWPQRIALLSVIAVTVQVLLFVVMCSFFIGSIDHRAIGWTAGLEALSFLVALPCAVKRRGAARWWLAFSSIYFLAMAGVGYLGSEIQF